jgi:dephospho-CoA kinase
MIRIALTGSIGMGKSTVAEMFRKAGIPVFDADSVVRHLQTHDPDVIAAIGERFGGTVSGGVLDRDALAAKVLGHPDELAALEAIIHPGVHSERARFLLSNQDKRALVFDIPLLFETHGEDAFDKVIVVSAALEIQRERVLERPGMTHKKLTSILTRQMPDEEKRRRADFVIDTSGELSTTESQVRDIIACLGFSPSG